MDKNILQAINWSRLSYLPVSFFWVLVLFFRRKILCFLYYKFHFLILCSEALPDIHNYNSRIRLPCLFSIAPCIYWKDKWILIEYGINFIRLEDAKKLHCIYGKGRLKEFLSAIYKMDMDEMAKIALSQCYYLVMFRARAAMLREKCSFEEENLRILEKLTNNLNLARFPSHFHPRGKGPEINKDDAYYIFEKEFKEFKYSRIFKKNALNFKNLFLSPENSESQKTDNLEMINTLRDYIKKISCDDIKCVLLEGSLLSGAFIENWSDVDMWVIVANEAFDTKGRLYLLIDTLRAFENFIDKTFGMEGNFKAHPHIRYLAEDDAALFFTLFPTEALGIKSGYKILYGETPTINTGEIDNKRLSARFIANFYKASARPDYLQLNILKNMPRMYFMIKEKAVYGSAEGVSSLKLKEWSKSDIQFFNEMLETRKRWRALGPKRHIFKALPAIYKLIISIEKK